ncbi:unnamed protein product [Brassicogethes aeneus]|uniref:PNPLA domain-containing protein n=1 Tax=Brassicogethes aeneus TaxID=1431903 RepID=A0A9P0AZX3_BRAAE|nr:unnamed protein product [Brassicogethes aeneus]
MSFSKNISRCGRCVTTVPRRRYNSGGSEAVDSLKMQAKSVVLNQFKLITQLKTYFSDKTFENALNKEFAHFLQKIQPKTYGSDLVRYFESSAAVPKVLEREKEGISLPNVFNGFKFGYGAKIEEKKSTLPKWKHTKALVSKESIACRTSQVVSSIISSESITSRHARIEELIQHLKQYPEAKRNAVKDGAIRVLLKVRSTNKDLLVAESLGEAISLLGHADPVPGKGIRILSVDGGGVRGFLVIEMLRKLEELTGKPVSEMFDLICGVSTGAILLTLAGLKRCSLDEVSDIYRNLSTQIFTQSTFKGTSNLVWSHSYYDTALWEKLLRAVWGEKMLIETQRDAKVPKYCAVSAVVNQARLSAYVFRNYDLPFRVQSNYQGGYNHKVWECVRASAAAPTYFEEFKIGNMLHQDGGILVNNPAAIAIHEAKLLWPNTPIQCVVSFGTGRTEHHTVEGNQQSLGSSSWKDKFLTILNSATDTEGVHTMLSDLLPSNVYYRFNPYLTEMLDIAEIDPQKIEQLKRDAVMYLRRNEDKFNEAAQALNVKKSKTKQLSEWFHVKKDILGFKQH